MLFFALNANDTDVHNEKRHAAQILNRILNPFSIDVNGVLFAIFQLNIGYSKDNCQNTNSPIDTSYQFIRPWQYSCLKSTADISLSDINK